MKRFLLVFLVLFLALTSCQENTGKGNMRIILESSTKTISPDEKTSSVVKYNVQGIGPDGKSFSKDSSSKSITIDGLTMGTWTINATGYNSESVKIVSGTKTFSFSNSYNTVYVNMSSYAGSGAIQINIEWDESVINPYLKIMASGNGTSSEETIGIKAGSSSYTYSKTGLSAGTYLLTIQLYNGDSLVTGFVETVQVINSKTTTGTISLKSTPGSSSEDDSSTSFSGYITVNGASNLPDTLEVGSSYNVCYVLDDKTLDTGSLTFSWFLDGTLYSSGSNSISLSSESGDHILNVTITDTIRTESSFYKFSSKTSAKKGSATLTTVIPYSTNKLALGADSIIGILPDSHYILITPSRSTMQIFTIYKNSVSLLSNATYNATDMRFTWLPQVSALYSKTNSNFVVIRTEENCVHLLYFNSKTGLIEPAMWNEEPLILSGFVTLPPAFIDNVTTVAMDANSIILFDSGARSEEVIGIQINETEITNLGTTNLSNDMQSFVCSDLFNGLIGVVTAEDKLKFANVQNGVLSSAWYSYSDNALKDIMGFKFLNSRYAIFRTKNCLKIYEYYPQQKLWVSRTTIDQAIDCFYISSDGAYIYFSDNEKNLYSYRSGLSDNFGKIYTQKTSGQIKQIVTDDKNLVAMDESGNLYILEIVQED